MQKESFSAGLLTISLHIGESRSLKDKRRIIKSMKDSIRNRFNASVAEVAKQDSHDVIIEFLSSLNSDSGKNPSVVEEVSGFLRSPLSRQTHTLCDCPQPQCPFGQFSL